MAEDTAKVVLEMDVDKAKKDLDALTKTIQELNDSGDDTDEIVKELEKQWDRLNNEINNAGKGQRNLAKGLKEVTKQLQVMKLNGEENTVEYQKLVVQAGALKDAMGDASQVIKAAASDTWKSVLPWLYFLSGYFLSNLPVLENNTLPFHG